MTQRSAYEHRVRHSNRRGFYRISYIIPPGPGQYLPAMWSRVVPYKSAVAFAARHNVAMPEVLS